MSYSVNSTYSGDLASYRIHNKGNIPHFKGSSYSINLLCNATTDADPDIGGPGVVASFIVTAWITLLVASVPAFYRLRDWQNEMKAKLWPSRPAIVNRTTVRPFLVEAANRLLESLCNLQLFTGIAIVIAGLSQLPAISFYHEKLAVNYWWFTVNSFWSAKISYIEEDLYDTYGRIAMRRAGILVSITLGLVFQAIINVREARHWNFLGKGTCFLYHDKSQSWPWIVGTAVYAVSLLFIVIPVTRSWVGQYNVILDRGQAALVRWQRRNHSTLCTGFSHPASGSNNFMSSLLHSKVFYLLALITSSFTIIFYWLLFQFPSFWSYGKGGGPLSIIMYFAYAAWITFDIVDIKLSNRALINGSEMHWGFGQILPMVLMIVIGYAAVDALLRDAPKPKSGACAAIPLQQQP